MVVVYVQVLIYVLLLKHLLGKVLVLVVDQTIRLNILNKLEDKWGVPTEEQVLIFAGKQLNDGQTVRNYDITAESTLDELSKIVSAAGYKNL